MTATAAVALTADTRQAALAHLLQVRAARAEALAVLTARRQQQAPRIPAPRDGA